MTPAIEKAGWDIQTQVREEVTFTAGRIIVRGKLHARGKKRRADYILYHQKNQPIAVIEAKDNKHSMGSGMQQALSYAEALDIPFVFSSNGDGFKFYDRTGNADQTQTELSLNEFPSPGELWSRYCQAKELDEPAQKTVNYPYFDDGSGRTPRYYQANAINRTIEAIAKGQNRVLLVMATGTGKTYTAFQIIWRLWKSEKKKRILFLADRNILVDQTKSNDFKPFGPAMTKIEKRQVNKAFEIYLSLYQAVSGNEEEKNIYKQFDPDFFDLIVIDECHRGSAREDSAWREILEYFSSATHVGLTATPKETKEVSNIHYFGEPVYTYSLKQGIEDGFLAPYKVIRFDFDIDLEGWRPQKGQIDKYGNLIEDRIFNQRDMDRNIVFDERTQLVALKVTEYLQKTDEFQKTIVFCDDIDHAERMREALVNLNPDRVKENRKYVMRITGDNEEGKDELDNFIDPESTYPVITTTSKLMTTGVDAKICKLIVLDQSIQSMTEFKQIIGRGTRIDEDHGKHWFTIMDFKKATERFADKDFDGEPVQIFKPKPGEPIIPPEDEPENPEGEGGGGGIEEDPPIITDPPSEITPEPEPEPIPPGGSDEGDPEPPPESPRIKYHVKGQAFKVTKYRVQHLDVSGKLVTESMHDYTKQCVVKQYASMDDFLRKWSAADKKKAIIDELTELGVFWQELQDNVGEKLGTELDPFDLICHIAFDRPALTRRERANNVKKRNYFSQYEGVARQVLETLLDKYADVGIEPVEDMTILTDQAFSQIGAPIELVRAFGGKSQYQKAFKELEAQLYYLDR
ncbi:MULTISPECIES: EcoAI/FtnUII family type I restriction enzme subunit R [unclassified Endozoicomonas]|uniref:EcoAI/FtnUII family type I restriction enzme subunit R n=1 Tax=unclassified Endozoicomonas TaxID=2644528 RepID=UPI003BB76F67